MLLEANISTASIPFKSTYSFCCFQAVTRGQKKDRERPKKKGRESGREEGKRELRELIILFNHILDEGQVVCGTESETERGE